MLLIFHLVLVEMFIACSPASETTYGKAGLYYKGA